MVLADHTYFCNFDAFKSAMKRIIQVSHISILSGLVLFLISCSPEQCIEETESYIKATLYDMATGKPQAPDTLTLYGLNKDSVLYDQTPNLKIALFPLYSETNNCTFIIIINGITDTLEFSYSSHPHLISASCGYTFFYDLENPVFTTNAIDSIYLSKSTITTQYEENMRIFY